MILRFIGFLLILLVALGLIVVYAGQNNQPITISLFENHWSGVAAWVPVAVAAAGVAVLFLLYVLIAGTASRLERGSLRRRLNQLEARLGQREDENRQLRDRAGAAEATNSERDARPVTPTDQPPTR